MPVADVCLKETGQPGDRKVVYFSFVSFNMKSLYRFDGETQPGLVSCKDAAKRLMNLGLVFTQVEDAVSETVESLKAKGCLVQKMSHS
ncbi:hypothetical protein Pint_18438 [Pistacia integerrima]|uniref:Uncharacterized protein n=1 Tax=Pistacia integerrima TaxID=434235 RepID=A0ACC0YW17_9ROSI|nr:hypothetical protein Pint_18438 [Pistacia integerrima]